MIAWTLSLLGITKGAVDSMAGHIKTKRDEAIPRAGI